MFYNKDILKNFAKFTGNNLCQSAFLNKVAGLSTKDTRTRVFFFEFCEILKNTFFMEHLRLVASVLYSAELEWQSNYIDSIPIDLVLLDLFSLQLSLLFFRIYRYLFCMNKPHFCGNFFFFKDWRHERLKNTIDLLLFCGEHFYGFSESDNGGGKFLWASFLR